MTFFARHALSRASCFLCLWIIVAGASLSDLPGAMLAVVAAVWASLVLLPPRRFRGSLPDLARLALRLLRQSVVAGIDVARRALDPRLPLNPGFVTYSARLPEGTERDLLCTMLSLSPGILPTGTDARGALLIHCLDVDQPLASQISVEEEQLAQALGGWRSDG